ncbi:MAG: carboxymuconolactone decarboxylase family protein [Pseudomonadota bacterium]
MSRLPTPAYDQMTDAQREVHDAITSGPRGSVRGPFLAWIQTPEMAMQAQKLGEYFRFNTSISRDLAEIAILVTGAHYKAEFEWWAHVRFAHEEGVSEEITEAIRLGREPVFEDIKAKCVYETARALNTHHRLTDDEFALARQVLGETGLMDVIGLCGYYALVSLTLNVYEMDTPDGSRAFD